jgi:hypothetical protein
MTFYTCELCNYTTKLKGDYNRHLKTKKHDNNVKQKEILEKELTLMTTNDHKMTTNDHKMTTNDHKISENLPKKLDFICDYCNKKFSTHPHKRRHELHYCKDNPNLIERLLNEKDKQIIKIEKDKNKEIEKLEKRVDKLTDKIGNTTIHNHTNNIQNNNNNNNIKINSYGNEDLSHITDMFKTNLLCNGPYGAIPKMIEAIHFNKDKPENNNIKLPNLNKKILKVKQGDSWNYKQKDIILYDLIDSKYLMLDEHFNLIVNGDKLSKYKKDIYKKFRSKYDGGDSTLINNIKEDCEIVIMNNREIDPCNFPQ